MGVNVLLAALNAADIATACRPWLHSELGTVASDFLTDEATLRELVVAVAPDGLVSHRAHALSLIQAVLGHERDSALRRFAHRDVLPATPLLEDRT